MNYPFINLHSHFPDLQNISVLQSDNVVDNQWFSFGIHPWQAEKGLEKENLIEILNHPKCLAIGEIGLDKLKGPDLEMQKAIFEKQISLSEQYQFPVIIHCVKAWNELKVLKRKLKPTQPWIFHGFSKIAILEEVLEEGMHVSFGMRLLKDNSLLERALKVPNDRVFLETDDAKIVIDELYSVFAQAKKIPLQELKEIQFRNFKRVFTKWKSG